MFAAIQLRIFYIFRSYLKHIQIYKTVIFGYQLSCMGVELRNNTELWWKWQTLWDIAPEVSEIVGSWRMTVIPSAEENICTQVMKINRREKLCDIAVWILQR